ncbi:MAG: hypothetical protein H0W76_03795 [Pyrinomonadaceae bacterium]|nr:hypothetical protein [Pyrinomonadaceae bacterium]
MLSLLLIAIGVIALFLGKNAIATKRIQYRRHVLRDSDGNPLQSDSLEGSAAVRAGIACVVVGVTSIAFGILIGFRFIS